MSPFSVQPSGASRHANLTPPSSSAPLDDGGASQSPPRGVALPRCLPTHAAVVSYDENLHVPEGTAIALDRVSTESAPALSIPPRSIAIGSGRDGGPTIVVSTREGECTNVYLEGPTQVSPEEVAALPGYMQSIYLDIDKLDEQRDWCQQRYMIARLPQMKRPPPPALAGATQPELEQVRLHYVDGQ